MPQKTKPSIHSRLSEEEAFHFDIRLMVLVIGLTTDEVDTTTAAAIMLFQNNLQEFELHNGMRLNVFIT